MYFEKHDKDFIVRYNHFFNSVNGECSIFNKKNGDVTMTFTLELPPPTL